MDNKLKKILATSLVLIFALSSYIYQVYLEKGFELEGNDSVSFEVESESKNKEFHNEKVIIVHLSGAVARAGVYQIAEDKRLIDLVKNAGGLSSDADLNNINLASTLADGQKIIIPHKDKSEKNTEFIEMENENSHLSKQSDLININDADLEKLIKLNGIGQSKAEAIIKYREKNGLFKSKESLTNVTGIGEKTLENIRDEISIR
ncbi:MAG: helix-hairpin-helix domain-containing protein [Nanoarchaeota archaeon]